MIHFKPEAETSSLHSRDENTQGLSLEQTQELLIKDLEIARERAMNKKFQLEMDGVPEDDLGRSTYTKLIAGYDLEIARINDNLRELGIESIQSV